MPRPSTLLWLCAALFAGSLAATEPFVLHVMTYNLRFASPQPPNAWPDRRPVMQALIAREAPDVFGTQEGLYGQLRELADGLPGYEWIGLGRAGGSKDEFAAIFYRSDRLEPLAFDHFWLSDTPEVIGSMTWGNHYRRMVTWVRFRDRATRREFEFWNTHFDHEVEAARQKSAALIRDRIALTDPAMPLVLAGDFNCLAGGSPTYDLLTKGAGLADTWTLAALRRNADLSSFNNFKPGRHESERIDWILVRGARAVDVAAVIDYTAGPPFPSDHFPVTAVIRF